MLPLFSFQYSMHLFNLAFCFPSFSWLVNLCLFQFDLTSNLLNSDIKFVDDWVVPNIHKCSCRLTCLQLADICCLQSAFEAFYGFCKHCCLSFCKLFQSSFVSETKIWFTLLYFLFAAKRNTSLLIFINVSFLVLCCTEKSSNE